MWLQAKTNISASTRRGYIARINAHLLPAFGQSKLTAISNNQIGKWVAVSIENGVGATVIKQAVGLMKQIYASAVLDGRVSRNPAIGVPLPRAKASEKQPLTVNQLKALAKECGDYELLVLFAGTTGLRWGELAALLCKDISLLNRSVNISKAYSNGLQGEKILGSTKTHQVRTVPFTKELIPPNTTNNGYCLPAGPFGTETTRLPDRLYLVFVTPSCLAATTGITTVL